MFSSQPDKKKSIDVFTICLRSYSRNAWVKFLVCMEFYICNLQSGFEKAIGADNLWPAIEKDFAEYFKEMKTTREMDKCSNQRTCIKSLIDKYNPMGEIVCHLLSLTGLLEMLFEMGVCFPTLRKYHY